EICGNAVLYFNAFDIDEMIIRVMQSFDKSIVAGLKVQMKERIEHISNKQFGSLENIIELILYGD
ncbi:MAG: hypothetical protein LBT59_29995, partial [Clostridiales bacterium]|nr:hypothetical protein [Clostridiales bacterium]